MAFQAEKSLCHINMAQSLGWRGGMDLGVVQSDGCWLAAEKETISYFQHWSIAPILHRKLRMESACSWVFLIQWVGCCSWHELLHLEGSCSAVGLLQSLQHLVYDQQEEGVWEKRSLLDATLWLEVGQGCVVTQIEVLFWNTNFPQTTMQVFPFTPRGTEQATQWCQMLSQSHGSIYREAEPFSFSMVSCVAKMASSLEGHSSRQFEVCWGDR